ncbi:hypothetical protein ABZP36_016304 [Zizania latifolia]
MVEAGGGEGTANCSSKVTENSQDPTVVTLGFKPAPAPATIRLVNFISEDQLDEAKRARGERVEDGTAQRDKPLFQILQENKEKKDARVQRALQAQIPRRVDIGLVTWEVLCGGNTMAEGSAVSWRSAKASCRKGNRPPKALDEDEMEFLDKLASSKKEYEQQVANEEAEQLASHDRPYGWLFFLEAIAARSNIIHELETPTVSRPEEIKLKTKRSQPALLKNVIISVKPQAKKAKVDADKPATTELPSNGHSADHKPPDDSKGVLGSRGV